MVVNRAQRRIYRQPHDVYRVKDAHGVTLYVGCSANAFARLASHRRYASWWRLARTVHVEQYPSLPHARAVERELIDALNPVGNTVRERGWRKIAGDPVEPIEVDSFTIEEWEGARREPRK